MGGFAKLADMRGITGNRREALCKSVRIARNSGKITLTAADDIALDVMGVLLEEIYDEEDYLGDGSLQAAGN